MMNFEKQKPLESLDLDKAYSRANEALSDAINPEDFKDIYKDVEKDLMYVEEMEKRFESDSANSPEEMKRIQKIARVLEGIIHEQGELSDWFGENATTITPSRYDDIKNGIDSIVEFEEGEGSASHLALAIDVVSGQEIQKKLSRIKNDIEEGHLSEIKYFQSEHLDIKGLKRNVPRVVIGADRKNTSQLIELWLNNDKKEMAEHHIQIQILKEIEIELEKFIEYSEKIGQDGMASIYKKTLNTIKKILKGKIKKPEDLEKISEDEVFYSIKTCLKNFSGEKD